MKHKSRHGHCWFGELIPHSSLVRPITLFHSGLTRHVFSHCYCLSQMSADPIPPIRCQLTPSQSFWFSFLWWGLGIWISVQIGEMDTVGSRVTLRETPCAMTLQTPMPAKKVPQSVWVKEGTCESSILRLDQPSFLYLGSIPLLRRCLGLWFLKL